MRTVIVLAIGIYLGRQLYLHYDLAKKMKKEEQVKKRLALLLQQFGLKKQEVENQLAQLMKD